MALTLSLAYGLKVEDDMIIAKGYIVTTNPENPSVADAMGCRVYWSQRGAVNAAQQLREAFRACRLEGTEPTVARVWSVTEGYTVSDRGIVRQVVR